MPASTPARDRYCAALPSPSFFLKPNIVAKQRNKLLFFLGSCAGNEEEDMVLNMGRFQEGIGKHMRVTTVHHLARLLPEDVEATLSWAFPHRSMPWPNHSLQGPCHGFCLCGATSSRSWALSSLDRHASLQRRGKSWLAAWDSSPE